MRKLFSEEAKKLFKRQGENHENKAENDIIFLDDVVRLTGYRKATIYTKICRFQIPVVSRRRPLTFSREAILQWMKDGKPSLIDTEADDYLRSVRKAS